MARSEGSDDDGFSASLTLFLSQRQSRFLTEEVQRRKERGETSPIAAAHGGNPNLNKGTILREALEEKYHITPEAA